MLEGLQLVAAAARVPLNVTVLAPWLEPKVVPEMVTEPPAGPDAGDKPVISGVTVKVTALLAIPETVTTSGPVVAPLGTVTCMPVALQLVAAPADVPLKVT